MQLVQMTVAPCLEVSGSEASEWQLIVDGMSLEISPRRDLLVARARQLGAGVKTEGKLAELTIRDAMGARVHHETYGRQAKPE